ncbi:glycosyltransferase family 9 protein [Dietzia kunjamensis]|uniref:glycosyltransferase family 9 protein n=1 Tax=Dietzia TaxID=37914 RepID=UPI001F07DCC1|nr:MULTISPECIES: glycosyltransferase family 9 protein [Dietzia]MDJ0422214.1 glycosyltransferase family 9 protein [Dietzia kunjamensis]
MPAEPYSAEALRAAGMPTRVDTSRGEPWAVRPEDIGPGDVLALRALGMGDALTGIAPLRGLRRLAPGSRLVLAAPAGVGGWLARLGVVDSVLPTPGLVHLGPIGGGQIAVDLHGNGPASRGLLTATDPGRLIGFDCPEVGHTGPPWRRDEHEVHRWCRLVSDAGGPCGPEDLRLADPADPADRHDRPSGGASDGCVVVHPGAAAPSRRWPVERWAVVTRALADVGHRVVVTGSADESALTAEVAASTPMATDAGGALDLDALTDLVGGAALVLSGDTGIAHLATALASPSVVLFGPVPPRWWGPLIDPHLHRVLWHGDPDADTWGDPHGGVVDPRLDAVGTDEVLSSAFDLLSHDTGRTTA